MTVFRNNNINKHNDSNDSDSDDSDSDASSIRQRANNTTSTRQQTNTSTQEKEGGERRGGDNGHMWQYLSNHAQVCAYLVGLWIHLNVRQRVCSVTRHHAAVARTTILCTRGNACTHKHADAW
jgi:hypothetical protein